VLYPRLRRWLELPRSRLYVACLSLLLSLPSLTIGLQADDYGIAARVHSDPFGAFRFDPPDQNRTQAVEDERRLQLPWWTNPHQSQAFFRPLASFSHWVDFRLWPNTPWLMHLENILLYAGLIVLVGATYRQLMVEPGQRVRTENADGVRRGSADDRAAKASNVAAGFSLFFYAFNGFQSMSVGWIAGRNTMLQAWFGLLCVLLHDRARRVRDLRNATFAGLCFVGALLSGEGGIACLGYLLAHALVRDSASVARRALALAPYMVIIIVWRLYYVSHGYGAIGLGFYRDLGSDPIGLLQALGAALVIQLAAQLTVPFAGLSLMFPHSLGICFGVALLFFVLLAPRLWPLIQADVIARFFALGALLSAFPLAATLPGDRLVFFTGFGVSGLLGRLLSNGLHAPTRAGRFVLGWLWRSHAIYVPLLFVPALFACSATLLLGGGAKALDDAVPRASRPAQVLINSPSTLLQSFQREMRTHAGAAQPSVMMLYAGNGEVRVSRPAERALELFVARGWLATPIERALRDPERYPFVRGQSLTWQAAHATILDLNARGAPTRVRFDFESSLDSGQLGWLSWGRAGLSVWKPPRIGELVVLAAVPPL